MFPLPEAGAAASVTEIGSIIGSIGSGGAGGAILMIIVGLILKSKAKQGRDGSGCLGSKIPVVQPRGFCFPSRSQLWSQHRASDGRPDTLKRSGDDLSSA